MKFSKLIALLVVLTLAFTMLGVSAAAQTTPTSGIITGDGVRLRTGPGTGYSILAHYYKGEILTVLQSGDTWVKVSKNGLTGYVSKTYFTYQDDSGDATATATATTGEELVTYAKTFLGVPYVWGGASPTGFDCSGFVQYIFTHFSITVPRTASQQYAYTADHHIAKSELKPGDLVFFSSPSSSKVSHVGIYVGDDKFIHANSPGGSVRITALTSTYYTSYYIGSSEMFG